MDAAEDSADPKARLLALLGAAPDSKPAAGGAGRRPARAAHLPACTSHHISCRAALALALGALALLGGLAYWLAAPLLGNRYLVSGGAAYNASAQRLSCTVAGREAVRAGELIGRGQQIQRPTTADRTPPRLKSLRKPAAPVRRPGAGERGRGRATGGGGHHPAPVHSAELPEVPGVRRPARSAGRRKLISRPVAGPPLTKTHAV